MSPRINYTILNLNYKTAINYYRLNNFVTDNHKDLK